jgi:hypothetical protein
MAAIMKLLLDALFAIAEVDDGSQNIQNESINLPAQARVSFDQRVSVILIPQASEYKKAGCDLWWTTAEYHLFKEEFLQEIRLTMEKNPELENERDAMKKICRSP